MLTKPRFALAFANLICIALASPPHSERGKVRTTPPTSRDDVLSGPTGSGSGARSPRRRRGRRLAFHKVAKEARQLGPIRKCRVRGILET